MTDTTTWYTEPDLMKVGTAFSLEVKRKLHEESSQFQRIAIYETTQFGHLMTLDDVVMLTDRDNFFYHEMMSHPALFSHPNPRNVVIIGGGDCGTLREVLRHPTVETVVQVEIDEMVTRVSEKYFPSLCEANNDPRATLLFADGIQWMKDAPANSVDVIIIDSTDPVGPAEGLFNLEFHQNCRRVLREEGVLAQQTESPLLHLPILEDIHRALRTAGFKNTRPILFPQCVYPSGWWSCSLASQRDLTDFRRADVQNKKFPTHYYNADIHQACFALPNFVLDMMQKLA